MMGEVIGITTMYIKGSENLNFAIPINDAKRLLLSKSLTLRDWPNEHESAKTEKRDHQEHAASTELAKGTWPLGFGSVGRRFYDQDYNAGVFAPEEFATAPDGSKIPLGRMRNADYVCFSDDARSDEFFTFTAWAYDKEYDESSDMVGKASNPNELVKYQEIVQVIKQGAPYISFLPGELVRQMRSRGREFFLSGGRHLEKDVYSKGVKIDMLEYHWDGTSWFFHNQQFRGGLRANVIGRR
jgi:hypothetical protein